MSCKQGYSCLTNVFGPTGVMSEPNVGTWDASLGSKHKLQYPCQDYHPYFIAFDEKIGGNGSDRDRFVPNWHAYRAGYPVVPICRHVPSACFDVPDGHGAGSIVVRAGGNVAGDGDCS